MERCSCDCTEGAMLDKCSNFRTQEIQHYFFVRSKIFLQNEITVTKVLLSVIQRNVSLDIKLC